MKKDFVFIPRDERKNLGIKLSVVSGLNDHVWLSLETQVDRGLASDPKDLRTLANGLLSAADKLEAGTLFDEPEEIKITSVKFGETLTVESLSYGGVVFDRRK